MAEKTPTFKMPKTLGLCADELYNTREQRKALQKEVDALTEKESLIKEHLINNLPKSDASGVTGKLVRVTAVTKTVAQVKDWDKFYAYIKKNNAFDLMQRRVSEAAVQERWEGKKKVPGVEPFNVVSISINKV